MPHVEDGQLHAWLDGAYPAGDRELLAIRTHMQDCADCRNRLDEAQVLRERAGEILNLAMPTVMEPPSFEQLSARQTTGRSRGSRIPAPARLAWAATIVIALGTGWLARGFLPSGAADSAVMSRESGSEAALAAPVPQPQSAAVAASPADQASSRSGPPADVPRQGYRGRGEGAAKPSGAGAQPEARRESFAADAVAAEPAAKTTAESGAARGSVTSVATPESVESRVLAERPLLAASRLPTIDGPAPTEWQAITLAQAREQYGSIVHVPELLVENVAVARSGSITLVRITQFLPDRTVLELLHTIPVSAAPRADAGREAAPAPPTAKREEQIAEPVSDATGAWLLTVHRGTTSITARAPVGPDSLRVLVSKLR